MLLQTHETQCARTKPESAAGGEFAKIERRVRSLFSMPVILAFE